MRKRRRRVKFSMRDRAILVPRPTPTQSAAPDRNSPLLRAFVHGDLAREAPHAPAMLMILHDSISNPASASRGCVDSSRESTSEPFLQHGMLIPKSSCHKRLLDHQQIEGRQRPSGGPHPRACRPSGIATEHDPGPAVAHPVKDIHVQPGLHLSLIAEARCQFLLDRRQQGRNRSLNPSDRPQGMVSRTPPISRDRETPLAALPVPDGVFQGRLGHAIAATVAKNAGTLAPVQGDSTATWAPVLDDHLPGAVVGLGEKNGRSPPCIRPSRSDPRLDLRRRTRRRG